MKNATPGSIVAITFLDHVEDGDEPLQCTAYGRLTDANPNFYRVQSWICHDDDA